MIFKSYASAHHQYCFNTTQLVEYDRIDKHLYDH